MRLGQERLMWLESLDDTDCVRREAPQHSKPRDTNEDKYLSHEQKWKISYEDNLVETWKIHRTYVTYLYIFNLLLQSIQWTVFYH